MSPQVKYLDEADVDRVKSLESKLGACIVAWEQEPESASLSEGQIKDLCALEVELGAVLVAYKS
jgi:hypothetical protein